MKAALLPDRGVVKVAGLDARTFLNGLLTTDVAKVTPDEARFGALLTPQGEIIVDCIVAEAPAEDGGGLFLDCPRALAPGLVEKLNFYKLRAKVICEDLSEVLGADRRQVEHDLVALAGALDRLGLLVDARHAPSGPDPDPAGSTPRALRTLANVALDARFDGPGARVVAVWDDVVEVEVRSDEPGLADEVAASLGQLPM